MKKSQELQLLLEQYKTSTWEDSDKLREILQKFALRGLYESKFFDKAVFLGGTALRIIHGINRFSEDLDFSLIKPNNSFNFAPYLTRLQEELKIVGFDTEIEEKKKNLETTIKSAFIKANTKLLFLSVFDSEKKDVHNEAKTKIKIEIDTNPPKNFSTEEKKIGAPFTFPVKTLVLSDLFAGKMHAVLCRRYTKGRDWYDLVWYLNNSVPLNGQHLLELMIQSGHCREPSMTKTGLLKILNQRINTIDWVKAHNDIRTFIEDRNSLKCWGGKYFFDLTKEKLQII